MVELTNEDTKVLGNWRPDTHESVYSSKLPLPALRGMGGHPQRKGTFYVPRNIEVPDALSKQVFPFLEYHQKCITECDESKPTASGFLRMLRRMSDIVVQDVAAMIIEGRTHCLFERPVFKSIEFQKFVVDVREAMGKENPLEERIAAVIPQVAEKLRGIENTFGSEMRILQSGQVEVKEGINDIPTKEDYKGNYYQCIISMNALSIS